MIGITSVPNFAEATVTFRVGEVSAVRVGTAGVGRWTLRRVRHCLLAYVLALATYPIQDEVRVPDPVVKIREIETGHVERVLVHQEGISTRVEPPNIGVILDAEDVDLDSPQPPRDRRLTAPKTCARGLS